VLEEVGSGVTIGRASDPTGVDVVSIGSAVVAGGVSAVVAGGVSAVVAGGVSAVVASGVVVVGDRS